MMSSKEMNMINVEVQNYLKLMVCMCPTDVTELSLKISNTVWWCPFEFVAVPLGCLINSLQSTGMLSKIFDRTVMFDLRHKSRMSVINHSECRGKVAAGLKRR